MKLNKFLLFLIKKITYCLLHIITFLSKENSFVEKDIQELREKKEPIIFITWHKHIFYLLKVFKGSGCYPLISQSKDGEIVAEIAKEFGTFPIRGSSSKGGVKAFISILRIIKDKKAEIFITADGPKGPAQKIKPGVLHLARKSKAPIVPVSWHSSKKIIFKKSWDKFMIPLPFSTINYGFGKPIYVQDRDEEELLGLMEQELNNLEIKMSKRSK